MYLAMPYTCVQGWGMTCVSCPALRMLPCTRVQSGSGEGDAALKEGKRRLMEAEKLSRNAWGEFRY